MTPNLIEQILTIVVIAIWIIVMILWKNRLFKKYSKIDKSEIKNNNIKKSLQVEIFFFAILGGLLFINKKKLTCLK